MDESMEITVVMYEDKLKSMLDQLEEAKKRGDSSVMIEEGAVNFHICSALEDDVE